MGVQLSDYNAYPEHGGPTSGHGGRQVRQAPRNGLGTAALWVGIGALFCAFIPILNLGAFIPGLVGVGLGIAAMGRVRRGIATNKVVSLFGLLLSVLAVVLSIVTIVNVATAVDEAFGPANVTPAGPGAPAGADEAPEQARFLHGQPADIDGLVVVAEGLKREDPRFGDPALCTNVSYTNNTDTNAHFNAGFDWKLQAPSGTIASSTIWTEEGALPSGELIPGSSVNGAVCFPDSKESGEFKVIFEPMSFNSTHVEWVVSR